LDIKDGSKLDMNRRIKYYHMNKLITILVTISPILGIYKMPLLPLSIGDFAFCVSIVISLFINKRKLCIKKNEMLYIHMYFMFILISFLSLIVQNVDFNISDFISKISRMIVYAITLDIVVNKSFDIKYAEKLVIKISVFLAGTILVQELGRLCNIVILPYLNWLPLNYNLSVDELTALTYIRQAGGIWRVSSVFPEPAHYCYYVLIGLAILLLQQDIKQSDKFRIVYALLITISIIISGSAIGFFGSALLWLVWIGIRLRNRITLSRFLGISVIVIIGVFLFIESGGLDKAMYRVGTIRSLTEGSTGGTRLLQGLYVFSQLDLLHKFIGIGFGNVSFFMIKNTITTPFIKEIGNEFMNVFSTVLVSGGVVSLIYFGINWIRLYISNKIIVAKIIWLVTSIIFCVSSIFYNCYFVFFVTFIIAYSTIKNNKD